MKTTRRTLLTGISSVLATIPFARSIPSSAGGNPFPKRLVVFYSPNDSMDNWVWAPVQGTEATEDAVLSTLPRMLEPLQPFVDQLAIVGNMYMYTRDKDMAPHPGGHIGMGHQLTGTVNSPWANQQNEVEYWGGGISLDQFIADELGVEALTLAAMPQGNHGGARISYRAKDEPVHPYEDPVAAFNAVFGDVTLEPDEQVAQNARHVRALDRVAVQLDRLRPRVGSDDRAKIEAHVDALLRLQEDLESFVPAQCEPTAPEPTFDYGSPQDFPTTAQRHMDVLVNALACDVTRVGSIQNGHTAGDTGSEGVQSWPSEGIYFDIDQHEIAHRFEIEPSNEEYFENRMAIETFYVRQFAYLLDRLQSIPEGGGTLLDNTLVVWTKGMGRGHGADHLLYLLAGGSGFPELPRGQYLARNNEPHNRMLVTIANLMGVDIDIFGDPEFTGGSIF